MIDKESMLKLGVIAPEWPEEIKRLIWKITPEEFIENFQNEFEHTQIYWAQRYISVYNKGSLGTCHALGIINYFDPSSRLGIGVGLIYSRRCPTPRSLRKLGCPTL